MDLTRYPSASPIASIAILVREPRASTVGPWWIHGCRGSAFRACCSRLCPCSPERRPAVTSRFHLPLVATLALLGTTFPASPVSADHDHDPRPALSGDVVRTWNRIAQDTVRAESAIDAQAARVYAMVDVAMYDAVNGILSRRGSNDRDHA